MIEFGHTAFGISIAADRPIPGLRLVEPVSDPTSLRIHFQGLPEWVEEVDFALFYTAPHRDMAGLPLVRAYRGLGPHSEELLSLRYADETTFVLDRATTNVWVHWVPPYTLEDAVTYLLGPVMGLVLRLREFPCLHASAFALAGHAILLAGPGGAGKSTTAAAIAARGLRVIAEDFVPVESDPGGIAVWPGGTYIRLWPESTEALYGHADALPLMTPNWEKRQLSLDEESTIYSMHDAEKAIPVGAVYVFGGRESGAHAPRVEQVSATDAFISLVSNGYVSYLSNSTEHRREFQVFSQLVQSVPVRRLVPNADLARLDELVDLLIEDATSLLDAHMRER